MKQLPVIKSVLATLFSVVIFSFASAQTTPPASPADTARGTLKSGAKITISYSSPSVKNRKIWGALVPFEKVWRAGANNATEITTDKDITVDGHKLVAGKYSIYAIPTEDLWSIIFSSQTGQPGMNHDGSTTLDFSKELFRALAKTKKSKAMNERLIYTINEKGFVLSWENLDVIVPMK